MDKVLLCDCGFEARGADDEALIEQIRRHAAAAHGMSLSRDEALRVVSTTARESASRIEKEER
jgi:predicted small metal-binding protein